MLRLGESWSAEQLSREYAKTGPGALPRTAIAKIEGGKRLIKAGETEGIARVFGLTSDDLLRSDQPSVFVSSVFLSYADQDRDIGQEISTWLSELGFRVLRADLSAENGPGANSAAAKAIGEAQAFIVLLTANFLSSPGRRGHLELAKSREQQLLAAGRSGNFGYVLRTAGTPYPDDYDLSSYTTIELSTVDERSKEAALSRLGSGIVLGGRASAAGPDREPLTRGPELDRILSALNDPSGSHLWLVISPPGFGKTWFLDRLGSRAAEPASGGWQPTKVDLRGADLTGVDGTDPQSAALTLIRRLFDLEQPPSPDPAQLLADAALNVFRAPRPWLCLVDSAELIPPGTVTKLRQHLGTIYGHLRQRTADARLAVVVAGQRDDRWTGLTPRPRWSVLRLAEFGANAVLEALDQLAADMSEAGRPAFRSRADLLQDAYLVQRVTEGMPELVGNCLEWIRAEEWIAIERLSNQQFFKEVITPYIKDRLLAQTCLLPGLDDQSAMSPKQLEALRRALSTLVPYRFITLAHVTHHCQDPSFQADLAELGWSDREFWQAFGDMAFLLRPLPEPWQKIHPAIRRLLYRHFYPGDDKRAAAHARARDFSEQWAERATGTDQVAGMVEAILHEAVWLRLSNKPKMADELLEFTQNQLRLLQPSAYNVAELCDYAITLMEDDDELQREVSGVDGLFDELIRTIQTQEAWEESK